MIIPIPAMRRPIVSLALRFPVTIDPVMVIALPVPIAGHPEEIGAGSCRHHFDSWRRGRHRRPNRRRCDDDADLGRGNRTSRSTDGKSDEHGNSGSNFHDRILSERHGTIGPQKGETGPMARIDRCRDNRAAPTLQRPAGATCTERPGCRSSDYCGGIMRRSLSCW